jgi:hypothetical protein
MQRSSIKLNFPLGMKLTIFPTIQINKTAFYPTPQKTLGVLQKISPVFAKTKK